MLQEGKGPINFTVFLTLFGEKLNGEQGIPPGPRPHIPPGPRPDPMCLQSLLPNPSLPPDLSTFGLPSWPL